MSINEILTENPNFVIIEHLYSFADIDALIGTEYYSKMYNRTLGTIVKIAYIDETKELIIDNAHIDIVALTNSCTVNRSLLLNKEWSSVPVPIAKDFYDVATVSGEHITVDRIGNVIFTYDSSKVTNFGRLSVGSGAIYDRTTGKSVFKHSADCEIISSPYNKTVLVSQLTSEGNMHLYAVLANGTVELIGATDGPAKDIEFFSLSESGSYYVIKMLKSNKYEYFNEYGESIGTSDTELSLVAKVIDGYILADNANGRYYKFTLNKIVMPNLYMTKK